MNGQSPLEILATLPARHQLMMLTLGRVIAPAIWVLTELQVADQLSAGPLSAGELAARTGTHPPTLRRILRCACAVGVFAELPDGRFGQTPLSEPLRAGAGSSIRDLVLMNGTELFWRPYEAILHTARTGETAFGKVFGESLFAYLESRPDQAAIFHRAMTAANQHSVGVIAEQIEVAPCSVVADVGGGQGHLLAELLSRHPDCSGVLLDRPAAIEGARSYLAERGVGDRVDCVAGDMFTAVPGGCQIYLLKHILHDWADADAARILRTVRQAMAGAARLLVIEAITGAPNSLDAARVMDVDMLIAVGGRERSAAEYGELAAAGGLKLLGQRQARSVAVLEFTPC